MDIYKMNEEEIEKLASDFNNTVIGRRIWLFSMSPQAVGFLAIILYLLLMIFGISNPEIKGVLTNYITADLIVLGISLILYGLAKMLYWKEVINYGNELTRIEFAKSEIKEKVKTVKNKVKKDVKNATKKVKKTIKDKK